MVSLGLQDRFTAAATILRFVVLLTVPDFIHSLSYPVFSSKRFTRSGAMHLHPAHAAIPIPTSQRFVGYHSPEYEDVYAPSPQGEEDEYSPYDKYPSVPAYGYYSGMEKPDGRGRESFGYVEDEPESDPIVDLQEELIEDDRRRGESYPYGQETWFEGGDGNDEANAAFVRNLMLAQMYQDASPNGELDSESLSKDVEPFPFTYSRSVATYPAFPVDDEGRDREYTYGVPVLEADEKETFENDEDESVKELESLRERMETSKAEQAERAKSKVQKSKSRNGEDMPLSKEEILRNLRLQKQINSRKTVQPAEEVGLSEKQMYRSGTKTGNTKRFYQNLNEKKGRSANERRGSDRKSQVETTALPSTEKPRLSTVPSAKSGQKEYVLPRPANPVRRPLDSSSKRNSEASVYDAIKRLLTIEEGLQKRVQKRYVLSEDQLASELSGLKKIAV